MVLSGYYEVTTMNVSAKQLKNQTGSILRQVRAGKDVLITYRGKAIARIISLERKQDEKITEGFGIWADHKETEAVQTFLNELRRSRVS